MNKIKFKPTVRFLQLIVLLIVLGIVVDIGFVYSLELKQYWFIVAIILFLFALIDLFKVVYLPVPVIERQIANSFSVGVNYEIKLIVKNINSSNIVIDIYDHFPEQAEISGLPRRLLLDKNEVAELTYFFKPLMRGSLCFTQIECLIHSPFSLWHYRHNLPIINEVRVYPNYVPVMQYALLATENRLSMMGIFKHRRRGEGLDFHQLREFRDGDSLRQIDWKASSRARKMIAREYQDERDQQIIVMMDCGHRMLTKDDDLSHFDHSLNALLLLSYVALKQGDSIGVSTFGHENSRWIKAVKGVSNLHVLLNGIYDLQPGLLAPDYSTAARELITRQRKRSFVIVMTNLRDDDSDDLLSAIHLLKKHHKVVVANLQEQAIIEYLDEPIINMQNALTVSAIYAYQMKRDLLVKKIRNTGINILDVAPDKLALSLTNLYFDLKVRNQI